MVQSDLLFRRLLKDLRPTMGERGFRRNSQNFVIESSECWGVVNFQKSLYSSTQQKRFTVNVAIAAKRVLRFYGEPEDKSPLYYKCHWEVRLGQLIPGSSDRWWTLSDEASYSPVLIDVKELIVDYAIPTVADHLTEERLPHSGARTSVALNIRFSSTNRSCWLSEACLRSYPLSSKASERSVEEVWPNPEQSSISLRLRSAFL